jgi:hypothetical protein
MQRSVLSWGCEERCRGAVNSPGVHALKGVGGQYSRNRAMGGKKRTKKEEEQPVEQARLMETSGQRNGTLKSSTC